MMTVTPSETGEKAEAAILADCVKAGYRVLIPFGGSCRYDLVLDGPQGFQTVQVKHGVYRNGRVSFRPCSSRGKGLDKVIRTYEDVDLFGVHCLELNRSYLVPTSQVGKSVAFLRVTPPKNGQTKGINWAKEYEIIPR